MKDWKVTREDEKKKRTQGQKLSNQPGGGSAVTPVEPTVQLQATQLQAAQLQAAQLQAQLQAAQLQVAQLQAELHAAHPQLHAAQPQLQVAQLQLHAAQLQPTQLQPAQLQAQLQAQLHGPQTGIVPLFWQQQLRIREEAEANRRLEMAFMLAYQGRL